MARGRCPVSFGPRFAIRPRLCLVAMLALAEAVIFGLVATSATGQTRPPATTTAQARLKERDTRARTLESLLAESPVRTAEALNAANEVLAIEREVLGKSSDDAIETLKRIADLHRRNKDWPAAIEALREVLALTIGRYSKDHWLAVNARWALARVEQLSRLNNSQRARLEKAFEQEETAFELYKAGNYRAATKPAEEALIVFRDLLGNEHPDTIDGLSLQASLLQVQGDLAGARPLLEQAIVLSRKAQGDRHPDYASSLNNLGNLLLDLGDLARARAPLESALAIRKQLLGERHPDFASSLNNLGALYYAQGDFEGSRLRLERAAAIYKEAGNAYRGQFATSLNNLAQCYCARGIALGQEHDLATALPLLQQVLALREQLLGKKSPVYAVTLSNMAGLLRARQDLDGARRTIDEVLALRKSVLGERHPLYASSLTNLAIILQAQGDRVAARHGLERALEIRRVSTGERHPEYVKILTYLATLEKADGDRAKALDHIGHALDLCEDFIVRMLPTVPERQRRELLASTRFTLSSYLSLTADSNDLDTAAYRHVLFWKGLAGADVAARRLRFAPASVRAKLRDLNEVREKINRAATTMTLPGRPANADRQLSELLERRESLEAELTQASGWKPEALDHHDVASCLKPDAALVDFFRYEYVAPPAPKGTARAQSRYVAFVVRRGTSPVRIELAVSKAAESAPAADPASIVDTAIAAWRRDRRQAAGSATSSELARLVWQPLAATLEGVHVVLIAPDGEFNFLPWGALTDLARPGAYLIERLAFAVVGSGRQFVDLVRRPQATTEPALLAVGGVDYDRSAAGVSSEHSSQPGPAAGGDSDDAKYASLAIAGDDFPHFDELAGSLSEAKAIADLFSRASKGGRTLLLRNTDATSQRVRAELPRHRYSHLATHGYFADEQVRGAVSSAISAPDGPGHATPPGSLSIESAGIIGRPEIQGFYPGSLAGLAWAGANVPPRDPVTGEIDFGAEVMTAEQVEGLDLSGCELTVLSACDTGQGRVAGGQGVSSLQRAFHQAGTRTVLASLWIVDDGPATEQFLTRFYTNFYSKRLPAVAALHQAQIAQLDEAVGDGLLPRYWAGWVLSGDPWTVALALHPRPPR